MMEEVPLLDAANDVAVVEENVKEIIAAECLVCGIVYPGGFLDLQRHHLAKPTT